LELCSRVFTISDVPRVSAIAKKYIYDKTGKDDLRDFELQEEVFYGWNPYGEEVVTSDESKTFVLKNNLLLGSPSGD